MSLSNYLELKLLDHVFGGTAYVQPSGIFVKLHSGDPGEDGTANSAVNTARLLITFGPAANGTKASNADVTWPSIPASETYTHASLWDSVAAGSYLVGGPLSSPVNVSIGGSFTLTSGQLVVSMD